MAVGDDATTAVALPETVAEARAHLFGEHELYFVPIRHHSPACAFALRHLLREVRPAAVLVEGPDDLEHLLPLLRDERTRTPVALLCQTTRKAGGSDASGEEKPGQEVRSSFFPFCDYSPEWIAVREGAALGAQVALIDLPWRSKAWLRGDGDDEAARSQMEERHLAHSRYLGAMAARLGCVDHNELWDRLFELRDADLLKDWRSFFGDVFAWCAMARLDYEPEVLEAEASLPRERHMAGHLRRWRQSVQGPIVVVTGGFHTSEILARWAQAEPVTPGGNGNEETGAWLIRYSFERLDALNGYAAGMPSPDYYQRVWEQFEREVPHPDPNSPFASVAIDCLTRFAQATRAGDQVDAASTASVQAAAVQAQRLAVLRGHAGPGRQDLLDAIRSCFIKGAADEGTRGFNAELRRFLGGTRIGDVPPSAGSPPLLEDARRLARAAGVRLDDSTPRQVRLDLYRKPRHRERSRYFHAMAYLDAGLAKCTSGPDFLGNSRLNLLLEEWQAAWSPLVEARLIELAADGASVEAVCLAKLRREEAALAQEGRGRSAGAAVMLLLRACLIGLHARLPQLFAMLAAHLDEDASLASVVNCGHRLMTLWRSREPLGVQQHPQLLALLERCWPAALFLLPDLGHGDESAEEGAVRQLLSLRELARLLAGLASEDGVAAIEQTPFWAQLDRFASDIAISPAVSGAAAALLYLDGQWDERSFELALRQRFAPGATPRDAVRYLGGVTAAAPELLLRLPELLRSLDDFLTTWDEASFIAHLPDLRQSLTRLRPQESAQLAERVAELHGLGQGDALLTFHHDVSEADLREGSALQEQLRQALLRSGLAAWLQEPA